jgi:hypothetical protein
MQWILRISNRKQIDIIDAMDLTISNIIDIIDAME